MNDIVKKQLEIVKKNREIYYNIMTMLLNAGIEQDLVNEMFFKIIDCDKQINDYNDWLRLTE